MNVTKKSILLAFLFSVVAISVYVYAVRLKKVEVKDLSSYPTFIAMDTDTVFFNKTGKIDKTMVATKTEYYDNKTFYKFDNPLITSYNYKKDSTDLWHIKGLTGEMVANKTATVKQNVIVYPSFNDPVIDRATADNLEYNFDNNDISSKDLVSIYGHTFKTEGTDFNFNLNTNVLTYKGKPHATYYPQNK
jgi:LPS export ABC transporter protein LptC